MWRHDYARFVDFDPNSRVLTFLAPGVSETEKTLRLLHKKVQDKWTALLRNLDMERVFQAAFIYYDLETPSRTFIQNKIEEMYKAFVSEITQYYLDTEDGVIPDNEPLFMPSGLEFAESPALVDDQKLNVELWEHIMAELKTRMYPPKWGKPQIYEPGPLKGRKGVFDEPKEVLNKQTTVKSNYKTASSKTRRFVKVWGGDNLDKLKKRLQSLDSTPTWKKFATKADANRMADALTTWLTDKWYPTNPETNPGLADVQQGVPFSEWERVLWRSISNDER